MDYDVMIRGGSVVDGSGSPPRRVDIGITDGRITAIADLAESRAASEIDAHGLVAAPGFVDAHTHADLVHFLAVNHPDLVTAPLRQGVTSVVVGNCGFSPFPYRLGRAADLGSQLSPLFGIADRIWPDIARFSDALTSVGLYYNVVPLVGHGSLRAGHMGLADRAALPRELVEMGRSSSEALENGAAGLSSGLIYLPGMYAPTEELVTLCQHLRRFGRPYVTHIRGESDGVVEAVEEAITIGRDAGVPVHISHLKAVGRANWGRTEQALAVIDEACRSGVEVTLDVYPYTAASTVLQAILPRWVLDGGPAAAAQRLRSRATRKRVERELSLAPRRGENFVRAATWAGIRIAGCPGRPELEGKVIADVAADAGQEPIDFALDLLVQDARVTVILDVMAEADVRRVLVSDHAMIGSDGIPTPGKPHPRWAGTFPRILGRYCRDDALLDLPTAVYKMTALPAARFGLRDRGRLVEGSLADIVVFDPSTILDRATFNEPLQSPSGVEHVLVRGAIAVANSRITGIRSGEVLLA